MDRVDIVKAAMDYCEIYMPYEPGARLEPDMEQAYKDGFIAGAIWANNANFGKTPNHIGMEKKRMERVASKIARVHSNELDGMKNAAIDGMEWALSHQWQEPDYSRIQEDREYLVRLMDGYMVAKWSKGGPYADESGILHWRNGNLWYPDGLVLAIMEIPEYERT